MRSYEKASISAIVILSLITFSIFRLSRMSSLHSLSKETWTSSNVFSADRFSQFGSLTHTSVVNQCRSHVRKVPQTTPHCNVFTASLPKSKLAQYSEATLTGPFSPLVMFVYSEEDLISRTILTTNSWEASIVGSLQVALRLDPTLSLLDFGCNIGVYTLTAAAMGRAVVAVDANRENLQLLDASLRANSLRDCVTLLFNGVAGSRTKVGLAKPEVGNIGHAVLDFESGGPDAGNDSRGSISTILASDVLEVTSFKRAVMKIDIEKHEYEFFLHADELFKRVDIRFVLMEWLWFTNDPYVMNSKEGPLEPAKVKTILNFFSRHNYKPFVHLFSVKELSIDDYLHWPMDVVWKKMK